MLLRTYGVVFLVVLALLVALSVAIYQKTFVDVVHVTLQTDRVGNQLAPPADVKLRGMIIGEVRHVDSNGERASVDLALDPDKVGLVPSNVHARLLPKTLFGEKFVDLVVPQQPSFARLGEGDVITQDRTAVAIELERVLDNLMPLLRTIKPAQLNVTLNAFATALEGRGNRLGQNLELVNRYFGALNPELETIKQDIVGLADVSEIYADAAPDLVQALRNFSVSTATVAEKSEVYAGFLAGTTGFATSARTLLRQNEDRIIGVASVSRPTLEVLARYSPEYPCLLRSLSESDDFIGRAFANSELHITLEVVRSQAAYRPGEEPAWGERSGPNCHGLPRPSVPASKPKLDDGSGSDGAGGGARSAGTSTSGRAIPSFLVDPDKGLAGTAQEQRLLGPVVAPVMGVAPSDVPDLAALLFGPLARGTAVSYS